VAAARDERNEVKKGASWALRNAGKRNPALREAALHTARELRASESRAARWVGSDAVRDIERAS
jgi:3-methyladenine DNA glycosylase AlkD